MQVLRTGLLPRNCIAYVRAPDSKSAIHTLYVVERPAGTVAIKYKTGGSHDAQTDENIVTVNLSWPHTQWLVRWTGQAISDLFICCTTTPIMSLEDHVFILPMPNIYEDGNGGVCLGNLVVPEEALPQERTAQLIDTVLNSLWNDDLMPDFEPLGLKGLGEWAERSAADPQFGLSLDYRRHRNKTLAGLIERIMGELA
jgi:hypothetical protein